MGATPDAGAPNQGVLYVLINNGAGLGLAAIPFTYDPAPSVICA
jgi:hypothetical protein